jgi:hypothetical protein
MGFSFLFLKLSGKAQVPAQRRLVLVRGVRRTGLIEKLVHAPAEKAVVKIR